MGRRAHHRVLNHGTLATLGRPPDRNNRETGWWNNHALISRLITPRRGNIGVESVAREVSIGRDTIQIDEVKIQTSPL